MKHENKKLLFDINEAIDDIQSFVQDTEFVEFSNSRLIQAAVERKFDRIGEALKYIAF